MGRTNPAASKQQNFLLHTPTSPDPSPTSEPVQWHVSRPLGAPQGPPQLAYHGGAAAAWRHRVRTQCACLWSLTRALWRCGAGMATRTSVGPRNPRELCPWLAWDTGASGGSRQSVTSPVYGRPRPPPINMNLQGHPVGQGRVPEAQGGLLQGAGAAGAELPAPRAGGHSQACWLPAQMMRTDQRPPWGGFPQTSWLCDCVACFTRRQRGSKVTCAYSPNQRERTRCAGNVVGPCAALHLEANVPYPAVAARPGGQDGKGWRPAGPSSTQHHTSGSKDGLRVPPCPARCQRGAGAGSAVPACRDRSWTDSGEIHCKMTSCRTLRKQS